MRSLQHLLRLVGLLLLAANLSSCASGSIAIAQTARMLVSGGKEVARFHMKPGLHYLRVVNDGHVSFLVLGYLESHPEGNIEVWYSAKGEVLELQNGRIVRTAGLATDWRAVRYGPLPPWRAVTERPITIRRWRDEMPDYRMNVADTLALKAIAPPADSHIVALAAEQLHWFEARVLSGDAKTLAPERYAVSFAAGKSDVVYAEQCLAKTLCLTWQRWPAGSGAPE